jgi:hypothetical protein
MRVACYYQIYNIRGFKLSKSYNVATVIRLYGRSTSFALPNESGVAEIQHAQGGTLAFKSKMREAVLRGASNVDAREGDTFDQRRQ